MHRYISKIVVFFIPLVILFYSEPVYLLIDSKYKEIVAGKEIYQSIKKSKQKGKQKKLILGDSVGKQLFSSTVHDDTFNSLACNQAISMAGHYFLLKNYLEAGNKIDTLYLVFMPLSFLNNLDQVYTFHYFLKPFYKDEYKPYLTQTVYNQVKKIPYYYLCREPYILTSNWAPQFVPDKSVDYTFLSPISIEYLKKIKSLSKSHHFKTIILPTPTIIDKKGIIDKMNRNEISLNGLSEEFENYFERIIYLDNNYFIDSVHLKSPKQYSIQYRNTWIK